MRKWVLDNILNHQWIKKKEYIDYSKLIKFIKNKAITKILTPNSLEIMNGIKTKI